jgi:hypothetical protein
LFSQPPTSKAGYAVLIDVDSITFGWAAKTFMSPLGDQLKEDDTLITILAERLGQKQNPFQFRALMRGPSVTLGSGPASEDDDSFVNCDEGFALQTCRASAARIEHAPSELGSFQLSCSNDDDIVTVNARRITAVMGPFPIKSGDICSVGARVFMFSIPKSKKY